MQSTAERRVPRVPVQLTVEVRPEGFEEGFPAACVDVGYGGMAMETSLVPDVGERLRCRFSPPRGGEPVETECEVVWAQDRGPVRGRFGLRFLRLGVREAEVVRALVDGSHGSRDGNGPSPEAIHSELQVDGCPEPLAGLLVRRAGALYFEQPLPFFSQGRRARLRDGTPVRVTRVEIVAGDPPALRVVLEPLSGEHVLESSSRAPESVADPAEELERTWREPSPFDTERTDTDPAPEGAEDSWRSLAGAQLTASPFDEELAADAPGIEEDPGEVRDEASRPQPSPREATRAFRLEEETDELLASVARPAWHERLPRFAASMKTYTVERTEAMRRAWARARLPMRPALRRLRGALLALLTRILLWPRRLARTLGLLMRPARRHARTPHRPTLATRRPPRRRSTRQKQSLFPASGWLAPRTLGLGLGSILVGSAIAMSLLPAPAEEVPHGGEAPETAQATTPTATTPTATTPPPQVSTERASAPDTEPRPTPREQMPAPGEVVEGNRFGLADAPDAEPYTIRLSLPAETLRGVATEDGFLVVVPGVMALDRAGPLAARHPYVARAMILNQNGRAELMVRFVPGKKPPYQVRLQGKRLEVRIGR